MKLHTLQAQLTFSHLIVTFISALILVGLTLGGYFVYLQTDWAAAWAGETAVFFADELAQWHDPTANGLNPTLSQEYVSLTVQQIGIVPLSDESDLITDPQDAEWLLIIDNSGQIIASNYLKAYPLGAALQDNPPPGFSNGRFQNQETDYANLGRYHTGQAPIWNDQGKWLGTIYYRADGDDVSFLLTETAKQGALILFVGAFVSVGISGIVSAYLAKRYGRRLQTISRANTAFAAGQLDTRISLNGALASGDEFAQLGSQFNQMADQIGNQWRELHQLADQNALLAAEARDLATADERNRLARELHDAIKQQLFGLNLTVGSIQSILQTKPNLAQERLGQVTTQVQSIQEELDQIIQQLRPASLQDKGLAAALEELAQQWEAQTAVSVTYQAHEARELSLQIEQAIYRIVQEALQNVGKHARATAVNLTLTYHANQISVQIKDNGVGFDTTAPTHPRSFGLDSMKQRVENLNGTLHIQSSPDYGTTINCQLPIANARLLMTNDQATK